MMTETLVEKIKACTPRITRRVLDDMYTNPFWDERYGQRGRAFAEQDSGYHLAYLVQSLHGPDVGIMVKYARWLQSVLVSRGMSTGHIDENFRRMATALSDELGADGTLPINHMLAAADALAPTEGLALKLWTTRDALSAGLCSRTVNADPGIVRRWVDKGPYSLAAQASDVICYLTDAVRFYRPDTFRLHRRWLEGFLHRRDLSADLGHLIAALRAELTQVSDASDAVRILDLSEAAA